MLTLVDGVVATGNFVFRAGEPEGGSHSGPDATQSQPPVGSIATPARMQGRSPPSPSATSSPASEPEEVGGESISGTRSVSEVRLHVYPSDLLY